MDEFDRYSDNGIDVYVRADVQADDSGLKIAYKKVLFMGNLVVDGMIL